MSHVLSSDNIVSNRHAVVFLFSINVISITIIKFNSQLKKLKSQVGLHQVDWLCPFLPGSYHNILKTIVLYLPKFSNYNLTK